MFPPTLPHAHPVAIHWFSFIFIFSTNFKRKLMNLFLPLSLRWVVYNSVLFHSLHPFPRLAWNDRPSPRGSSEVRRLCTGDTRIGAAPSSPAALTAAASYSCTSRCVDQPCGCRLMRSQTRTEALFVLTSNWSSQGEVSEAKAPPLLWTEHGWVSPSSEGMQYYYFSEIKHAVCTYLQMFDEMSKSVSIVFRLVFFVLTLKKLEWNWMHVYSWEIMHKVILIFSFFAGCMFYTMCSVRVVSKHANNLNQIVLPYCRLYTTRREVPLVIQLYFYTSRTLLLTLQVCSWFGLQILHIPVCTRLTQASLTGQRRRNWRQV
jgi:hypothetical protein